jgi:phospholipid-binding lipoprotein MlaA
MEWYVSASVGFVQAMDARARAERYFKFRNAVSLDDYAFVRDAYIQYRNNLIYEGKAPVDESIYHDDEDDAATQPSTQSATQPTSTTKPASPPSPPAPPETPKPTIPH